MAKLNEYNEQIGIDFGALPTPFIVVDEKRLIENLKLLKSVSTRSGCKVLLAQKAFSMYALYPILAQYLDGATSSGLFEAKLSYEQMKKETHVYAPAFAEHEIDEIVKISDYIIFNSIAQYRHFGDRCGEKQLGLRVNPEHSTQDTAIYDPCSPGSRLGELRAAVNKACGSDIANFPENISGLHFHSLCEQNTDALEATVAALERRFGDILALEQIKWLNLGGGHHITKAGYDVERLVDIIKYLKDKYQLQIYIEPGEAVVLGTGFLAASVLDITENNGVVNAILDTSATCHMPDVLEMPYRPEVVGAGKPGEKPFIYRFGGPTCLAGDIIGEYSFDEPLKNGDVLVFCDMAHYTMVKSNMFNGMNLPSTAFSRLGGQIQLIKSFGYEDFKSRL